MIWPQNQDWLDGLMHSLVPPDVRLKGHCFGCLTPNSGAPGLCFGFTMMAVQAMLIGEFKVFDQRLIDMYSMYLNYRQHMKQVLTLDMLTFLNGVELYSQPQSHRDFFESNQPLSQQKNVDVVMSLVLNKKITDAEEKDGMGGMASADTLKAATFSGAYTKKELTQHFEELLAAVDKNNKQTLCMALNSTRHSIAVGYDHVNESWYLVNVDKLPVAYFKSVEEIANAVHEAFGKGNNTIFSTHLYSTKKHETEMLAYLNKLNARPTWQSLHQATQEKAKRKDKDGASWLTVATIAEDEKSIDQLLKHKADPNVALKGSKETPLWIAASAGSARIVELLLEAGANPTLVNKRSDKISGKTPLEKAVLNGHHEVIDILRAHEEAEAQRKASAPRLFDRALNFFKKETVAATVPQPQVEPVAASLSHS